MIFSLFKRKQDDYEVEYYLDDEGMDLMIRALREFDQKGLPIGYVSNHAQAMDSAEFLRGVAADIQYPQRVKEIADLLESLQRFFHWGVRTRRVEVDRD